MEQPAGDSGAWSLIGSRHENSNPVVVLRWSYSDFTTHQAGEQQVAGGAELLLGKGGLHQAVSLLAQIWLI